MGSLEINGIKVRKTNQLYVRYTPLLILETRIEISYAHEYMSLVESIGIGIFFIITCVVNLSGPDNLELAITVIIMVLIKKSKTQTKKK